jgi:hypothetical protein
MRATTRGREYLVFVSHCAKDTWVAKQIAGEIKSLGATPFLDEAAIEIGADFEREILKFLAKAHELVVLVTPWALERPYVWAELGAAWGKGIRIAALLHGLTAGELQARPGVPVFLKQRNLIDLNDVEKYFNQLARRVKRG